MDNKPVPYAYDNTLSGYSMAPASVPPQPLTPITPIGGASELPIATSGGEYYRRDSYPSSRSSIDATPSSSGSSASYTSPSFSETVVSPTASEPHRDTASSSSSTIVTPADYDTYSPLNGLPETESVAIPPLMPPPNHLLNQHVGDFDTLPDLLRQDRKADYSPRRPMNSESEPLITVANHIPQSTSSTCVFVALSLPSTTPT